MNMTFSYGFYTRIVTDWSPHVVALISLDILLLCFIIYDDGDDAVISFALTETISRAPVRLRHTAQVW